jgi:phage terminase large subunit
MAIQRIDLGEIPLELPKPKKGRVRRKPRPSNIQLSDDEPVLIVPGQVELPFDLGRYVQNKSEDMIPKSVSLAQQYMENPFLFVENELGISCEKWPNDIPPQDWTGNYWPLWSKQREILSALVKHRRVAVRSGHGLGKSFTAAIATMYLAFCWHALGVTTAPTFRQVERVLWGEIHYLYNQAGGQAKLGGILKKTALELGDKWFVEGISVRDPQAAITGFHEETVFAVIDEAGGVSQDVFDALEGILTSANSFVLLIGNPIDANGPFADAFKPKSPYYQLQLSCLDCPNVRHGVNIYPKLVSHQWPAEKKHRWGTDSNLYRVRVCGDFPLEGKNSLIPMRFIDLSLQEEPEKLIERPKTFGLDVARQGTDSTVIGVRMEDGRYKILEVKEKLDTTNTIGLMVKIYNEWTKGWPEHKTKPCVNVDDIGVGGGVTDGLIAEGIPTNGINGSEPPDDMVDIGEDEELKPENFLNKRAFAYWRIRRGMQEGQIFIDDEDLANELSKIPLAYTPKGQIKIENKDKIRALMKGASPDRADSMQLAWAADEADSEKEMLRFL